MKKILAFVLAVLIGMAVVQFVILADAYSATLNLKATWTPNTEPDMASYNLYRTDGSRVKLNTVPIPHPPTLPYLFSVTVPDGSTGTASFVLTAVDTSGNESVDSNVVPFQWDLQPPVAPKSFGISK